MIMFMCVYLLYIFLCLIRQYIRTYILYEYIYTYHTYISHILHVILQDRVACPHCGRRFGQSQAVPRRTSVSGGFRRPQMDVAQ